VFGQMAQSGAGGVATRTGAPHYVTGPESLEHLHRLRARVDAVVVGWRTVEADDPRLTVRRVEGPDPVRVVVDPRRRTRPDRSVYAGQGGALRLVDGPAAHGEQRGAGVHEVVVPSADGRAEPAAVLAVLRERGLRRVLVEGGGRLVSSFLRAGALDRLHVVVAPLLVGEGKPGVVPTPVDDLGDAVRPAARTARLGADVLFDLDLRAPQASRSASTSE
ncbi:MAG: RibD family protein, partial [Planctomycetota bacterium]